MAQGLATCENGESNRNNNQKATEKADQESSKSSQQNNQGRRRLGRVKKSGQITDSNSADNGHPALKSLERSLRPNSVRSRKTASPIEEKSESRSSTSGMQLRNRKTIEVASRLEDEEAVLKNLKYNEKTLEDCGDADESVSDEGKSELKPSCLELKPSLAIHDEQKDSSPTSSEASQSPANLTPPSGGRLKLTLRMKRSPVLDEVIESGSSMATKSSRISRHHKNLPIYEVCKVEGLDCDSEVSQPETIPSPKIKQRKRLVANSSPRPEVSSTTKRLRLILGNESRTIDLPASQVSGI